MGIAQALHQSPGEPQKQYQDWIPNALAFSCLAFLQCLLRIHLGAASQMHNPGLAALPPGDRLVAIRSSALLGAFGLLQPPDGEILQPGGIRSLRLDRKKEAMFMFPWLCKH